MGATPMSGMHHPQQIARLVDPARRERPAHLPTATAAIAEGTEPMTTWRAPVFFDAAGRRAAMVTTRGTVRAEPDDDTSSRADRSFVASREWRSDDGFFDIGEIVAWILIYEEDGQRGKD